ncbi:aldehyde dehydrogenase domain-containing protein [Lasiosphaeria hispida]|uniref:Aldehyde dehydrogenase domain-containing protein n=1 Tax=Lasiosphaeria hispida TaxID=260671 RepID=A0AAJ0MJ66_9PEZI|nr:aldehyde dehydrogenase domain-containing protein [Lasiosphaeria hispida]
MGSSALPRLATGDIWSCDTPEKAASYLRSKGTPIYLQNYVSGAFILSDKTSVPFLDSFEPKTGAVFACVPCTQSQQVDAAIRTAKDAFPAWSKTTRAVRSGYLRRVSELLQESRELFAVWESIDQGKTLERARIEVDRAIANFLYFSTYILHEQTAARMIDGGGVLTYEHRSPAGVFALISPWNMPLYLLTWKIAPCLAFGCTAVAKPSEVTSMSAYLLAAIFHRASLPPGVINIVFGDGPTTGAALVSSPLITGVSFTGGTQTGIAIRRATAHQIGKHVSLELGGKNPTLVFADALRQDDKERTIRVAASAAFENQGEICLCGSRIYVEESVYEEFLTSFVKFVQDTYVLGKTVGAVVSRAHFDKVRGYLKLAEQEGATFELGGVPLELDGQANERGYWIAPTVLADVQPNSALLRDEIFGPVVTVSKFKDEEEAVGLANDSEFGLAAVLLTADGARMRRVGEQLEAGMVWVNGWLQRELGTPFGGMKASGTGREGGEYSRDVFTVVRTIHLPSQH